MSSEATLRWMAELQARFSGGLRTPLDARGGMLKPNPALYPRDAARDIAPTSQLTAAERLGIYQRQYWMRLLNVLHEQYPLTTRLFGAWFFNRHALRFLLAVPPQHHDLGRIADGFDAFLARHELDPSAKHVPHAAVVEAARVDAAFRYVFLTPAVRTIDLEQVRANGLPPRLCMARDLARIEEHWPLLALRGPAMADRSEHALPLPAALPARQYWLLRRGPGGVVHVALDPFDARLFELLDEHSVNDALAELERTCPERECDALPERVRAFFERGARHGLFSER